MTRRRFYAPPSAFNSDSKTVILDMDETRHLRSVLRVKTGDEVFVFDGEGGEYNCRAADAKGKNALLEVKSKVEPYAPESPLDLTLALGLLKNEKFDLAVQKATELGVTQIAPVITTFSDVRPYGDTDAGGRVTRWRRIALEAAKQSGRARFPLVEPPMEFDQWLGSGSGLGSTYKIMFSERGGCSFAEGIKNYRVRSGRLSALIGSEGGWSDKELVDARQAGWTVITLGGRILRSETAVIVVATLLQHQFGDLS